MHYSLKMMFFLLCGFGCIKASGVEEFARDRLTRKYFKQQEEIYQELLNKGIPGARRLNMDEKLAEQVLINSPKEVEAILSDIEYSLFSTNKKNIIFQGPFGTGKSAMAQAIAIKSQVPCLFFNAVTISIDYMNSGGQNLNKIFEYAQELVTKFDKPCVIVFFELELLLQKYLGTNHSENNIFVNFWRELDRLSNSKVIAIGTMNDIEDLPDQITHRTSIIKIPLPTTEHREAILSYHLRETQKKYDLIYHESVTAAYLAQKTRKFSSSDLENLVIQATKSVRLAPVISGISNKIVTEDCFDIVIEQMKKNYREKWKRNFKKHWLDLKNVLPVAAMAVILGVGYNIISNQKEINAFHRESVAIQDKSVSIANQIKKDTWDASEDVAKIDPELYEVFLKIKQDYGITDNVHFRILRPLDQLTESQKDGYVGCDFAYTHLCDTVIIRDYYKNFYKSYVIHGIAHELEHHRQWKRNWGSYFDFERDNIKANKVKMEIGADAAAADYLYCADCLAIFVRSVGQHNPQETDLGYVTTPLGYFSKEDYKLYYDRAKEACALCVAHQKLLSDLKSDIPLKDYLPPIVR